MTTRALSLVLTVPALLLLAACGDDTGGTTGGGSGGTDDGGTGGRASGGGTGGGTGGGSSAEVEYPELEAGTPSCALLGEVSGGDTQELNGTGCTGFENDINVSGGNWQLFLNVVDGFEPIEVGEVPLEEVRYRFEPEPDADNVYFSVGGESCEVNITDSELQGGAIPSLAGTYVITGTGRCDAPLAAEAGTLDPVTLAPFAFRAIYSPE